MKAPKKTIFYSPFSEEISPLLRERGLVELPRHTQETPEFIISYAGDGTFLFAERQWPGIPKLVLRRSRVCKTCRKEVPPKALDKLMNEGLPVQEYPKITFHLEMDEVVATSDIILRNLNPNQALRFRLEECHGGTCPTEEIIGDGLVLATPIGAGAYYRSITGQDFSAPHFGLAFNNPTQPIPPVLLDREFSLSVRVVRESAILCLDNLPCFWNLRPGQTFEMRNTPQMTHVFDISDLYCKKCKQHLGY